MAVVVHRPGAPVLVGRTAELHALLDAIAHPPAIILIEGEAGIGKTRLVQEALAHPSVRQRTVLAGSCHPIREPFPYGPIFEVLRQLVPSGPANLNPVCGALRPYLPELAERLPPAPEHPLDHRAARHQLFRAVRELLSAAGTAVLVVEDLHWADDGTRDLIQYLIDAPPAGLALVMTYRREELASALPLGRAYRHPPGTTSVLIPLLPLDVSGVRSLTATILGRTDLSAEVARELHERTAGIPFVLEELLRGLRSPSVERDTLDTLGVPTLLREAMADRMAALSPTATSAVRAAAILRLPAGEALIAKVAGIGAADCGPSIRAALAAGVLHELVEGRYGFRHSLAQQAVYDAIAGPDRQAAHRRAGEALAEADPRPLVQLAYHARRAEQIEAWVRHGAAAADRATALGDTALAVEILEGMLSDPALPPRDESRLAINLSRVAVIGLSHERVVRLLRRIVRDNHLPEPVRGEIRLNLGLLLVNQAGECEQGRVDTELAVEELRSRPALAARGMAALAMPGWGEFPLSVCREWIARAERLVADQDDPGGRMAVRGNGLALSMNLGEPEAFTRARQLVHGDQSVAEQLQVARTYGNLADAAAWLGHFGPAQRFRQDAQELAAKHGAPWVKSIADGTALRLDWHTGNWPGLAARAREVLHAVHGVSGTAGDAHLVAGLLAVAGGEWDEATEHLAAAGIAAPVNAPAPVLAAASGALIRIHLSRGELAAACAEADRAVDRVRRKGIWVWAADLGPKVTLALVRGGRLADASAFVAEFADGVAGLDAPLAAAALDACAGVLALAGDRREEAVAAFEAAEAGYAALPMPYYAYRAAEAAARCRLAAGDRSVGRDLAATAERFVALGATSDAARCRRELRAAGVAMPSSRGRRGYGAELSPREREVAKLVAAGHTNREIAEMLFLSPRTVEQHVAKSLRKLGVSARGEVATLPLDS